MFDYKKCAHIHPMTSLIVVIIKKERELKLYVLILNWISWNYYVQFNINIIKITLKYNNKEYNVQSEYKIVRPGVTSNKTILQNPPRNHFQIVWKYSPRVYCGIKWAIGSKNFDNKCYSFYGFYDNIK